MKKLLPRLGLVAAASLALMQPLSAATLRVAGANDILTFDPHAQNHQTTLTYQQMVYEALVRYDKDYDVEPALATSWEFLSPTQLRFKLRQGVKFHDGSPLTADDVRQLHRARGELGERHLQLGPFGAAGRVVQHRLVDGRGDVENAVHGHLFVSRVVFSGCCRWSGNGLRRPGPAGALSRAAGPPGPRPAR